MSKLLSQMGVPISEALKKSTADLLMFWTPHMMSTVIVCAYCPSLKFVMLLAKAYVM